MSRVRRSGVRRSSYSTGTESQKEKEKRQPPAPVPVLLPPLTFRAFKRSAFRLPEATLRSRISTSGILSFSLSLHDFIVFSSTEPTDDK